MAFVLHRPSRFPALSPRGSDAQSSAFAEWASHVRLLKRSGNSDWRHVGSADAQKFWNSRALARATLLELENALAAGLSSNAAAEQSMTIPSLSPDGFDINVFVDRTSIRATFGGLDHDFTSIASLMVWVNRGLSSTYRLRTVTIGAFPREWFLEPVTSGAEQETLSAGHLLVFAALRKKTTTYRQNCLFA